MIIFNENCNTFSLHTKNTTYQIKISELGHLLHLYYGEKIADPDVSYLIPQVIRSHESNPPEAGENRIYSLCAYPQEFSSNDVGDYRISSIELVNSDGSYTFVGKYRSHKIYKGKYRLETLPTLFATDGEDVETLEIELFDEITGVSVTLYYGVFAEKDIITRAVKLTNGGQGAIRLQKLMSASIDFMTDDFDILHFFGHHYFERRPERHALKHGSFEIGSTRGSSGHFHNPFAVLCDPKADEQHGDAYGFLLMYSGNFELSAEVDGYSQTRVALGINHKQFEFKLDCGEAFEAPEALLTYSKEGFSKLSHNFHDIFRNNACDSKFVKSERPVILNSWEPFRFTFDEEKLVKTAELGKKLGADLFVLDDGWFGQGEFARDNEKAGLGDWTEDPKKLPNGLKGLADKLHAMGLKFGLWFEPEMVNENSNLFKAHPNWCLRVPDRAPSRSRHQLCLDLANLEVCEYLITAINNVLDTGCIDYVKWDYNRYVCDVYSACYPADRQGEIYHRYILGLYRILDGIVKTHPDILFEGCSGGGGRFDGAMLCYHPQIWCSDNTDAESRLTVQYGTSFAYPVSTMGAHVSACPNKKTKRVFPWETRAAVAMHGTFGYELDPAKMTDEEMAVCLKQTEIYRKNQELIFRGDYYRLSAPNDGDIFSAWQFVSKDKARSLVFAVTEDISILDKNYYVHVKGLDPEKQYTVKGNNTELTLSGKALDKVGLLLPHTVPPFTSFIFELNVIV